MKKQLILTCLLSLGISPVAHAVSNNTWEDISDVGLYSLIGSALVLPTARSDWDGLRQAGYSLAAAEGVALLGKAAIDRQRPDNSDNDSFPSGHASVAFASATTIHLRYGWQYGLPAYAVATLTATARVEADKHHWSDVIAGAAIGGISGWLFTDAFDENVQLVPWADSKSVGITTVARW